RILRACAGRLGHRLRRHSAPLPEHESQLATVLQKVTLLSVTEMTETVRVEPNYAYVVSPNQHLTMVDGELTVSPNTLPEERRAPVDIFFRPLTETHHTSANFPGSLACRLCRAPQHRRMDRPRRSRAPEHRSAPRHRSPRPPCAPAYSWLCR